MADEAVTAASAAASFTSNIDISTPAVVVWGSSDALLEVTFDARRLDSTNDAFFKLRRTVTLKAAASTKTPLFIFIQPERIKALDFVEQAAAEPGVVSSGEEARKRLGSDTVCLRFVLTRPADLVGPKTLDLTPKNKNSGDVLDSLRSFARHDSFAIYFPRNVISQARLKALCEAANNGSLKSIARQADLTSLYRGKGGQVIVDTEATAAAAASTEADSPPSYDELGPGPPPAPLNESGEPSKKRRRRSSGDVRSAKTDPMDIERMCRKIVDEQRVEMLKLVEEQQSKLYDRLIADLKPFIGQELEKLEHRILDHVEQRSGKQAEEQDVFLEQRLEEVQDEINDTIESRVHDVDEKVEEEFYGLRVRLEEFIEEEMAHAEERMVEHLQNSASISLQFNP
ncbi:hypothetical protein N0V93_009252 [Gnomoniopsis smithogilvyi]|uniref:Uncharacterized protein n=1 Tax=Gnomoniopsis smithogilvyi TaxID=1191159 RepID=A0A9W8YJM5_9PEZI|nr:hypothetical protein N0V93_009252 [Gnomoniopsis smithogilvyi]